MALGKSQLPTAQYWLNPGSREGTTRTNCDETGDYNVPNVLSPRDLFSRPDNMDETVLSSLMGKHSNLNHRRLVGLAFILYHRITGSVSGVRLEDTILIVSKVPVGTSSPLSGFVGEGI